MITRRVPGAVGVRAARAFDAATTQYLQASTGLDLGANDPFFVVMWARRSASTNNRAPFSLGVGTFANQRYIQGVTGAAQLLSIDAASTASNAQSGANTFVTGSTFYSLIGEWASTTSRRIIIDGTATSNTDARTITTAPTTLRVGNTQSGTNSFIGDIAHLAVFAGTASDSLIALHRRGVHPTQLPGQLLECWDLDRVGALTGLVRGTVLTPVNGGSLTPGPAHVQGPPTRRRQYLFLASASGSVTGTVDITAAVPTVAVTGTPTVVGTTALTATTPTVSVDGAPVVAGVTALTVDVPTVTAIDGLSLARPSSTADAGSWTAVGAASLHAATSDSNASTYIASSSGATTDTCDLGFPAMGTPDAGTITFYITYRSA